jgi:anthranilate 1,2-dioxygenase small subunit
MQIDHELRARIDDLFLDYAHAIDDDDVEDWPDFFTDDAAYQITTREAVQNGWPMAIMRCEGIGQIRDRVTALRKANIFEPHHYNHILSRPRLKANGNGMIYGRTHLVVYRTMQDGGQERFAVGRYEDRIVEAGGTLRLRERKVILDSRRVDVLLVYPL